MGWLTMVADDGCNIAVESFKHFVYFVSITFVTFTLNRMVQFNRQVWATTGTIVYFYSGQCNGICFFYKTRVLLSTHCSKGMYN